MLTKLFLIVAASAAATNAFACHDARDAAEQVIGLKDGSTLYVFSDGKMAVADRLGRTVRKEPGMVMESKDGQKITMRGDEVARLGSLLQQGHID